MKKKLAIIAAAGVLLAGAGRFFFQGGDRLHTKARKEWKEKEIAGIARRVGDSRWLSAETNRLAANAAKDSSDPDAWLSERLVRMNNGEWIAYASECTKKDPRIRDIFIGRGSDGKWYYSTYHFCIGMLDLRLNDQPDSLAKFAEQYSLRAFDGSSDECLNLTWPPKRK